MEIDPGDSTDYVDFPSEKPFVNSPSKATLREHFNITSPQPAAFPETSSVSILSALQSLQERIKELELNRGKTLIDLENVSKTFESQGKPSTSTATPKTRSSVDSAKSAKSAKSATPSHQSHNDGRSVHSVDSSKSCKAKDEADDVNVTSNSPANQDLSSNPSTPRNVKEASRRSSAIGRRLEFVENQYGNISSSLQNLRSIVMTSKDEMTTRIISKEKDRTSSQSLNALTALQNLEKERASLKVSQSLAEARIKILEKELENNRRNNQSVESGKEEIRDNQPVSQSGNQPEFEILSTTPPVDQDRLIDEQVYGTPQDYADGTQLQHQSPVVHHEPIYMSCVCDHHEFIGVRKGRERLCQTQRQTHERNSSKSPGRRTPSGRTPSPGKGQSRCHYRLNMKHVPFVVGKSTTASHSLTANIQTLVAKLKSHDSGLCEHIRQVCDNDGIALQPDHSPTANEQPSGQPDLSETESNAAPASGGAAASAAATTVHLKEMNSVLNALQDEFAAMSFEHHEITNKLKQLGIDDRDLKGDDIRSASQNAEILSLENHLQNLVAKMNVKGKQIKVLKKIVKGLKEKNGLRSSHGSGKEKSPKNHSGRNNLRNSKTHNSKTTRKLKLNEVELKKCAKIDVQEGIMVKCLPTSANGARQLLYGIKDLQRNLQERDISWH